MLGGLWILPWCAPSDHRNLRMRLGMQVDGRVLGRLYGNGPMRWFVQQGSKLPLPGGPLDGCKFAVIEPDEMTRGAGVDDGVARTVVGVHFHGPAAKWAIEPPPVLLKIDRNR